MKWCQLRMRHGVQASCASDDPLPSSMSWTRPGQDSRQGRATAAAAPVLRIVSSVPFFLGQHPTVADDAVLCSCPFRRPCTVPLHETTPHRSSLMPAVWGPHPHPSTNQPKKMHPLNEAGSCLCLPLAVGEERRGRSSRAAANNGDLLQQGQGRPRRRRARIGIPMDARRRVPPPPLDHRRRFHAHQARLEGRQPGRHGRLPGKLTVPLPPSHRGPANFLTEDPSPSCKYRLLLVVRVLASHKLRCDAHKACQLQNASATLFKLCSLKFTSIL